MDGAGIDVATALSAARAAGVERLDAQLILAHHLGQGRAWLLAHGDSPLAPAVAAAVQAAVRRRSAGEPLAYVLGEAEFCGLRLRVDAAVLVPRPETEALVDWALECLPAAGRVVDLGTGSGAIALALRRRRPDAFVWATELSPAALRVARGNASRLGLPVAFAEGDWWAPLAGQRFDLALSNPPYIAAQDPHLPALAHEPLHALTPGGDGLGALRAVIAGAGQHLNAGAWLLLEHGHDQGEAVRLLLNRNGFTAVQTRHDLAGLPRCSGGRWTPGTSAALMRPGDRSPANHG